MTSVLIHAAIVFPDRIVDPGWVRVDGELITEVGEGPPPDADETVSLAGRFVAPGFVDMHVHGGGGASVQSGGAAEVQEAVRFHRVRGTTTMLASLVSAPLPDLASSVAALRELVADGAVAGIHLEGPFLAAARCGAHDPAHLCAPSTADLTSLLEAGGDAVTMITLAPELDGGVEAVRQIVDAGVIAALGHTDASYDTTRQAIEAGARVATHLFNGMPPMHHRTPGPVLALAEDPRVTLELIHDGEHLHDAVVRGVFGSTGPGRVALVSDAIAAAGLPAGEYSLGGLPVTVSDGAARLAGATSLAGSVITVADAVRNSVAAGVDLHDAVTAATLTPARALGLAETAGSIGAGRRADLAVLDELGGVVGVMSGGRWLAEPPR